jgi:hypothetical protein
VVKNAVKEVEDTNGIIAFHWSIPCTPWGRFSPLNMAKSESTKAKIEESRGESLAMLERARELTQLAAHLNPAVNFEWVTGSCGWNLDELQEFEDEFDMVRQPFEGCQFGLVAATGPKEGTPIRKGWTISTNVSELQELLSYHRCTGPYKCEDHARIEGALTAPSGTYPEKLGRAIIHALGNWRWETNNSDGVKAGGVKISAVRLDQRSRRLLVKRGESMAEHVRSGHMQFRNDCVHCIQGSGRDRQRKRVKDIETGVLSLDVAGPVEISADKMKYILVGTYTVKENVLKEMSGEEEKAAEAAIEAEREGAAENPLEWTEVEVVESDEQDLVDGKVKVLVLVWPMKSKSTTHVLEGVQEFELRMRREGLIVQRVHSDRSKEFVSDQLQKWCRNRGIYKTTTVSDDPAANGRAENAVGKVKRAIRTLLLASDLPATRWSSAARYVGETCWRKYKGEESIGLAFGARVLVRTKNWYLATTFEARAVSGRFLGPDPETSRACSMVLTNTCPSST